jgi:hypothetical protein
LRALADALPLLRLVIETRKDQIAGLSHTVRSRDPKRSGAAASRIAETLTFLACPDRRHSFAAWLRMWLEDMLVIDAASLYPGYTKGGDLYSLDVMDGSTVTPLVGEDGRSPEPPDPAYQQVLDGVPAADFAADELIYLPRNPRPHRLYGMSPVEQIALTVNIALRRDMATLDYYHAGSTPDAFATLPKDWTLDQIKQFQDYFDALMSGNLARRRMVKFMPAEFKLTETRQPPLKDQYDEWLARVICYAFSIPPSAFVSQVNRATSESLRIQASQEGLVPLKAWVKGALDHIVQVCLKQPDLEFAWVGDDMVDPLQQAQTLSILVGAGIKTKEEARADLGLAPEPTLPPGGGTAESAITKYNFDPNQPRDENGRWEEEGRNQPESDSSKPKKPAGVDVASNDPNLAHPGVRSDVVPVQFEPDPNREAESQAETRGVTFYNPATRQTIAFPPGSALSPVAPPGFINLNDLPSGETYFEPPNGIPETAEPSSPPIGNGTVADAVAPNGVLPGVPLPGSPGGRNMLPSENPDATALKYVYSIYNGQTPSSVASIPSRPNAFVVLMPDGTYITYRPSGQASKRTPGDMATVEINSPDLSKQTGDKMLELKFPKK